MSTLMSLTTLLRVFLLTVVNGHSPFHQSGLLCLHPAGQKFLSASLRSPDGREEKDVEDDEGDAGDQVDTDHSEPHSRHSVRPEIRDLCIVIYQ